MKHSLAVVIERPFQASFREVQLTEFTPDTILCRTTLSAISSGTDMKTWRGQQHPDQCWYPLVPGSESVGVVEKIGPEATTDLKVGDRVMINECRKFGDVCAAWGGNSHYVLKNKETAPAPFDYPVKIPANVSDADAVLAYLACVSLKGIKRFTFHPEETILVIGAGMIGLSAVQIIKILNPTSKVICIDRSLFRCDLAKHYADEVFLADGSEVEKIKQITGGNKADKVIECSGNASVVGMLHQYIKDGGWTDSDEPAHIHLQGDYPETITLDSWHRWFVKNATVTMSCALSPGTKEQVLEWMSTGQFNTRHMPIETWEVQKCHEAFTYKQNQGDAVFKLLLKWPGEIKN